jgi:hypothetical protein
LPDVAVQRTGNRIHTEHYVQMIDAYPQTIRRRIEELAEELAFTVEALALVEHEEATEPTPRQILDMAVDGDAPGETTVRGYLVALLGVAWESRENYNAWGNSGWEYDLYRPLINAGFLTEAEISGFGFVLPENEKAKGARLIAGAIEALRVPEGTENPDA